MDAEINEVTVEYGRSNSHVFAAFFGIQKIYSKLWERKMMERTKKKNVMAIAMSKVL